MSKELSQVAHQLRSLEAQHEPLSNISIAGEFEACMAQQWNGSRAQVDDDCVHDVLEARAQQHPDAVAIDGWDGSFTYEQLSCAVNRLANHLTVRYGVILEEFILVCFEKSVWFFIAVLAVNKAGGAWVPLDPEQPFQRSQQVVGQTGARLALTSVNKASRLSGLVDGVVAVSAMLDRELQKVPNSGRAPGIKIPPDTAAYVIFTSGSTGVPKGVVMEHGALLASQTALGQRLGVTLTVRMLQFASFGFDASIAESLMVLLYGACCCVPSEEERLDGLAEFVRRYRVNWAFLTPSLARTMDFQDMPFLELLILGAEAVDKQVFDVWFGKVRLFNAWGLTETCVINTLHEWQSAVESPTVIGKPVVGRCWLVEPSNDTKLVPMGTVGEVVVQGPTVMREYLGQPFETKQALKTATAKWMLQPSVSGGERFFKTGDLAFYDCDGNINYVGRKDDQVKIRGLRIELGEVEHHVKVSLEGVNSVSVGVIATDAGQALAAYLCFGNERALPDTRSDNELFLPVADNEKERTARLTEMLMQSLPKCMVPAFIIPCAYMPLRSSGKLDRHLLARAAAALSHDALLQYAASGDKAKENPVTDMEKRLRDMWADILHLPVESIGRHDDFLGIGGDSIGVMRLVAVLRAAGFFMSTADVFRDGRLSSVAAQASQRALSAPDAAEAEVVPFELLSEETRQHVLSLDMAGVEVEDAYPCSQLQQGLMVLSVKQPGSYVSRFTYRLAANVDTGRFKRAWEQTVHLCSILRARIVLVDGQAIQVIVNGTSASAWDSCHGLDAKTVIESWKNEEMTYGSRLCRYGIVEESDGGKYLMLMMHHAIYDGWSIKTILWTLEQAYHGRKVAQLPRYSVFIKYTLGLDEARMKTYWMMELRGSRRAPFPPRVALDKPNMMGRFSRRMSLPEWVVTRQGATRATVLRAAWALILGRYCENPDKVCFGEVLSGRGAPVKGAEAMAGPMIATVPVPVRLDRQQSVASFLHRMQMQAQEMVEYEQYGLHRIARVSTEAKEACDFSTLLAIQPAEESADAASCTSAVIDKSDTSTRALIESEVHKYDTFALVLQFIVGPHTVDLVVMYNTQVLAEVQCLGLTHQLEHVVGQLLTAGDATLGSVSFASRWDIEQMTEWNKRAETAAMKTCVHDVISEQVMRTPLNEAVFTSSGVLTYHQLDGLATQLTQHLHRLGVGPGSLVPFCMEKSAWVVVAMFAILKAGAAFVPLDVSHPRSRLEDMVQQVGARVMIVSPVVANSCRGMVSHVVELSLKLVSRLRRATKLASNKATLPRTARPDDLAYVMFTSGSTGRPKGVMTEHAAVCGSLVPLVKQLGITRHSRVLQFASYVFDVSILDNLGVLMVGGAVCVPTETQRWHGLEGFIEAARVNTAMLTPSVVHTLVPSQVPTLRLLLLAGEAPWPDLLETWVPAPGVRIINVYGPCEAAVACASHWYRRTDESATKIGRGVAHALWVVDVDDHDRLAPVGCVGELVIESECLGRGYLGDEVKTQAVYLTRVKWLEGGGERGEGTGGGRGGGRGRRRLYKTGDLVRLQTDGGIEYLGRVDGQVKIRGQRVEVGEIEYWIRRMCQGVRQVVVGVVGRGSVSVLAFVSFRGKAKRRDGQEARNGGSLDGGGEDETSSVSINEEDDEASYTSTSYNDETINGSARVVPMQPKDTLTQVFSKLSAHLADMLPDYMVPKYFVPIEAMPQSASGKLDRRLLFRWVEALSVQELVRFAIDRGLPCRPCWTETELWLRSQWAKVLDIAQEESISADDNFYHLGGDSIRIITIAKAVVEEYKTSLSLSLINSNKTTIGAMAKHIDDARSVVLAAEDPLGLDVMAGDSSRSDLVAEDSSRLDLMAEVAMLTDQPWVTASAGSNQSYAPTQLPKNATILLTGATGFLGTEILRQLLYSDKIGRVVALVRGTSTQQGLQRVIKTASIAGWWREGDESKLEVWVGDLAACQLGLSSAQWERLCGESQCETNMDAIVHDGAAVNWHADYETLRGVNVDSTVALLRAAVESPRRPRFVFVSGGVVASGEPTPARAELMTGYVQTKFVAETVVCRVAAGRGGHVAVVMPGRIIGRAVNGVANVDDFVWRVVASAASMGTYPDEDGWIRLDDVGNVAAAVVGKMFADGGNDDNDGIHHGGGDGIHQNVGVDDGNDGSGGHGPSSACETYTLLKRGMPAHRFWAAVNTEQLDAPCVAVPWESWAAQALEAMRRVGPEHVLWPVQDFVGRLSDPRTAGDVDGGEALEQAVRSSVRYLKGLGRPLPTLTPTFQYKLDNCPGKSIIGMTVCFPPNASTPPHRHGGASVTTLVLQGSLVNQMNDGPVEVVDKGRGWYEAPGCHHTISDNASASDQATLLAVFVVETEVLETKGVAGLVQVDEEYRDVPFG